MGIGRTGVGGGDFGAGSGLNLGAGTGGEPGAGPGGGGLAAALGGSSGVVEARWLCLSM